MTTTPNLGLTQYAGTDTMNFLTQYNTDLDKIDTTTGKLSNLTTASKTNLVSAANENVTNIGTLASLKTAVKTSTVNAINEVYDTTDNGWISARATLTYASASAPTFVCNTSIDLTTRISVGMKIKLTQTTTKYFFVTAITSTTITLYGGATYSVINATILNVYFSSVQLPYGFPIAKDGLGVDFPIEQGSNANGRYTKWASGKLEMNGFYKGTSSSDGSILMQYPAVPILDKDTSLAFISVPVQGYGDTILLTSEAYTNPVGLKAIDLFANVLKVNQPCWFHWEFKGSWK